MTSTFYCTRVLVLSQGHASDFDLRRGLLEVEADDGGLDAGSWLSGRQTGSYRLTVWQSRTHSLLPCQDDHPSCLQT